MPKNLSIFEREYLIKKMQDPKRVLHFFKYPDEPISSYSQLLPAYTQEIRVRNSCSRHSDGYSPS